MLILILVFKKMSSTSSEDEFDDASNDYINEEAAQVRRNWVSIETVINQCCICELRAIRLEYQGVPLQMPDVFKRRSGISEISIC